MSKKSLSIIGICKSELVKRGFAVSKLGAQRDAGVIVQGIGIQRLRNDPGSVGIILDILVRDDFQSPPDEHVCLRGYLFRSGRPGFHAPDRYWPEEQLQRAIPLLLTNGIRWLEEYGDPARLQKLLDLAIETRRLVEEIVDPKASLSPETEITREILGISGFKQARLLPAAYYKCASLIEYNLGNTEKACLRANQYLERLGRVKGPGEPEKTQHQLKAMGCGTRSETKTLH